MYAHHPGPPGPGHGELVHRRARLPRDAHDGVWLRRSGADLRGGGLCTGTLNVFKDEACSVPLLSDPLSSSGPACFDLVPAGLPLGSKTVEALAYQAGSCMPSGGEALGAVEASLASTFCCLMG